MTKEIAVYIDESGQTAPLHRPGTLVVYGKWQKNWQRLREMPFSLNQAGDLSRIRQQVAKLLAFLGDCKIFVALSVTGLPYYELEKAQCSVWEFEGLPQDFLDHILAEETLAGQQKGVNPEPVPPKPREVSPGRYAISLKEVQAQHAGVTSKQVLLPFLRRGKFSSLEITCSHVPPWLENEIAEGCLLGRVERLDKDEFKISITPRGFHR